MSKMNINSVLATVASVSDITNTLLRLLDVDCSDLDFSKKQLIDNFQAAVFLFDSIAKKNALYEEGDKKCNPRVVNCMQTCVAAAHDIRKTLNRIKSPKSEIKTALLISENTFTKNIEGFITSVSLLNAIYDEYETLNTGHLFSVLAKKNSKDTLNINPRSARITSN